MKAFLLFCILTILNSSFAVIDNEKRGGHGLFNGFEEIGKTAWLEEPKMVEEFKHTRFTPERKFDESLVISIAPSSRNDLLENSDTKLTQSSIYLQPEPRGLQYMLNTADFNPFLGHFLRKRDSNNEFVGSPNGQGPYRCQKGKLIMCALRTKRNTNLQDGVPGNFGGQIIPGSRGQGVLLGFPNGNQNIPGVPGNFGGQIIPGSRGQGVLYGFPNGQQNNPGVPGNFDGQTIPGSRGQAVSNGAPNNLPTQNTPDGTINYLYKTHGY